MKNIRYGSHTYENRFLRRSHKLVSTILGAGVLSLGLVFTVAPNNIAHAQDQSVQQKNCDIPAGPLGKSLNTFASQARITLSFTPSQVSEKTAPALSGSYSTEAGLQTLLANSGLNVVREGGAYKIQKAPEEQTFLLDPISVYGRQKNDSVKDIPQSVHVIGDEPIELTQANTVGEVLRLMPNASRAGSGQDMFADDFRIRGYDAEQSTNGLGFTRTDHPTDLANVERIEVLNGPSSVLYGQMEPGGTVNVVTKQPLPYLYSAAKVEIGSYDSYRGEADITGPVNDHVRLRFNAAYEDNGAALDNWGYNHKFFAPNVTIDLTDDTNLTIEGGYSENAWTAINTGTPFEGSVLSNPLGQYNKNFNIASSDSYTDRDSYNINTRLTHSLTEGLDARLSYTYTRNEADSMEYYSTGVGGNNRTVGRRVFIVDDSYKNDHEVIADLSGEATTGSLKHKFIAGLNYREFESNRPTKIYTVDSIDLYNPTYTKASLLAANQVRDRTTLQEDTMLAAFLQDRVTWDNWHFLAGLRFIDSDQTQITINNTTSTRSVDELSQSDWTTQFGLIYDVTKNASLYASRSESFVPQQGTTSGAKPLEAEEGTQYEIGTKLEFGELQAQFAAFHLTKDNIAIEDPANTNFEVAEGQSRTKGIEASVSGNLIPELYLAAHYGFTKSKIHKTDDADVVGNRFANVPLHTASLQGRYDLKQVNGLSLGSTIAYTGARYAENENTTKLDHHTRVDFGAFYSVDDALQVDFLVNNVFDEEIYSPGSINGIVREEGRIFKLNLEYTF